jgi:hypothetical protein
MRHTRSRLALVAVLLLGACSKPAPAPDAPPAQGAPETPAPAADGLPPSHGMVMQTTTVISNAGSDALIGYRILIGPTGDASYVSGDGTGQAHLPDPLSDTLKADVDAAKQAPAGPTSVACAANHIPVSVAQGGYTTGDLACPANDAEKKLADAVTEIVRFLKLRNVPKAEGKALPPINY